MVSTIHPRSSSKTRFDLDRTEIHTYPVCNTKFDPVDAPHKKVIHYSDVTDPLPAWWWQHSAQALEASQRLAQDLIEELSDPVRGIRVPCTPTSC